MRTSALPRHRDSILEALEILRAAEPAISLTHTLAFLYICENEGLNISELSAVCRTTIATASRTARALTAATAHDTIKPSAGWVESRPNPADSKGRVLYLTEAGQQLRARIDVVIHARQLIVAVAEPGAPVRLRRAS
jgi:DNA-binding MarR family transcriptional regulator